MLLLMVLFVCLFLKVRNGVWDDMRQTVPLISLSLTVVTVSRDVASKLNGKELEGPAVHGYGVPPL